MADIEKLVSLNLTRFTKKLVYRSGARYFTNMSVVAVNKDGWVLDSLNSPGACLQMGLPQHNQQKQGGSEQMTMYQLNSDLFKILAPFRKDSEFQKLKSMESGTGQPESRKRKRKRKEPLNIGEQLLTEYHDRIKGHLHQAYTSLVELGQQEGHFTFLSGSLPDDNNEASRRAADVQGTTDWMMEACGLTADGGRVEDCGKVVVQNKHILAGAHLHASDLVHTVWHHKGDNSVIMSINYHPYIIPPRCSFLMSDFNNFKQAYKAIGMFDLIVMDPPWTNQSVKRKKKYYTLDNDELLELPMTYLMLPGCLVVVWVTNKLKNIDFVKQQLFPSNHIQHVASWYWLKVTVDGQCVVDMNSLHKKPYETIIIGRYTEPADSPRCEHSAGENGRHADGERNPGSGDTESAMNSNSSSDRENSTDNNKNTNKNCDSTEHIVKPVSSTGNSGSNKEIELSRNLQANGTRDDHGVNSFTKHIIDTITSSTFNGDCVDSNNKPPHLNLSYRREHSVINEGHKMTETFMFHDKCMCESDEAVCSKRPVIPDRKVIVSIPCSLHSKKPVLYDVLRPFLPADALCLEMFARNLVPGWSSWGNEVLLHQHVDLFKPVDYE